MDECLGVIDCFISSIQKICVRCRNAEDIIGSSIFNFLTDFLHLDVHFFLVIGDRCRDVGVDSRVSWRTVFNTASGYKFMVKEQCGCGSYR